MADDSFFFAHDCFSPYLEYLSEDFIPGAWRGVTFATFRDFAISSNRDWVTKVIDFGLGILGLRKRQNKGRGCETIEDRQKKHQSENILLCHFAYNCDAWGSNLYFLEVINALEKNQDVSLFVDTNSTRTISHSLLPNNTIMSF